jgi:hypothetical protein
MKIAIGEIIDRYAICKLKFERGKIDTSKEMRDLFDEMRNYDGALSYLERLYKLHGEIWNLESAIKSGNENLLGLEEIGRRAILLRDMNKIRIDIKNEINSKYNEGYIEVKIDHGSEVYPSLIITLTTVPERLAAPIESGLRDVIDSICTQHDDDYEVHFNIPRIYNITKELYAIPDWLEECKLKYNNLKIFRPKDIGPPTKLVPTLKRVKDPETILLVVDDDLIYHSDMISEHRKYQKNLNPNSCICYEGRGSDILLHQSIPGDIRDSWIICVTQVRAVHSLQHYKSVSYKKKLFDQDFFDYYLGRTLSDDALVSQYFMDKDIKMFVVPYEPDSHLYTTWELWQQNERAETFPVVRNTASVAHTGCNHPKLLEHPLGDRFYWPRTLGDKSYKNEIEPDNDDYDGSSFIMEIPIDEQPIIPEEPLVIVEQLIPEEPLNWLEQPIMDEQPLVIVEQPIVIVEQPIIDEQPLVIMDEQPIMLEEPIITEQTTENFPV